MEETHYNVTVATKTKKNKIVPLEMTSSTRSSGSSVASSNTSDDGDGSCSCESNYYSDDNTDSMYKKPAAKINLNLQNTSCYHQMHCKKMLLLKTVLHSS